MSRFNFDDVKLFDDEMEDNDIMKTIIDSTTEDEPFCILDIADVVQKHRNWIAKIPRIVPHYGITSDCFFSIFFLS